MIVGEPRRTKAAKVAEGRFGIATHRRLALHLVAVALLAVIGCAAGGDVPVRNIHHYFTSYRDLSGPLFTADGPSPYDVEQGDVGTCWLLAAMAATAHQQPQMIRDMFEPLGLGKYRVTFHGRDGRPLSTTIDAGVPFRWFASEPLYAGAPRATWVGLLEKAYARAFVPDEGYEGIGGDHPRLALARLTGWPVRDYDIDGDLSSPSEQEEWDELFGAYRRGAPMVAGSRIAQVRADVLPMHAYAVTVMERSAGDVVFVRLFDPEGLNAYPNHELRLTLDEFVTYFYYVSIAQPPTAGEDRTR